MFISAEQGPVSFWEAGERGLKARGCVIDRNPGEGRIVQCEEAEVIVLMGQCPAEEQDLHIR